jgi:hypothetical protein
LPKNKKVHIYIKKKEKVWQTQVKAIYIDNIRCNFSATLCILSVYGCEDARMRGCEDARMRRGEEGKRGRGEEEKRRRGGEGMGEID